MKSKNKDRTLDPMVGYRDGYEAGEKACHEGDMAEREDVDTIYNARDLGGYQLAYCEGFQDGYDDAMASLFGRENEESDDYDLGNDEEQE